MGHRASRTAHTTADYPYGVIRGCRSIAYDAPRTSYGESRRSWRRRRACVVTACFTPGAPVARPQEYEAALLLRPIASHSQVRMVLGDARTRPSRRERVLDGRLGAGPHSKIGTMAWFLAGGIGSRYEVHKARGPLPYSYAFHDGTMI